MKRERIVSWPCVEWTRADGTVEHIAHGTDGRAMLNAALFPRNARYHRHTEKRRTLVGRLFGV